MFRRRSNPKSIHCAPKTRARRARRARVAGLAWLLSLLACGGGQGGGRDNPDAAGGPPPPVALTVDTTQRFQTMEGFGGALAFYVNFLVDHPNRSEIYDLVFRDLGLDILRVGNWYQNRVVDESTVTAVAAATASLGHPPRLLMSSWSPPASLKSNADTKNGGTLILQDGGFAYEPFAQWWVDALAAYAARGVKPDFISIQNEPDFKAPSWESCLFGATENIDPTNSALNLAGYDKALDAVYARVQTLSPVPQLLGPEVSGLDQMKLQNYLAHMTSEHFSAVAHHLYSGGRPKEPDSFNATMQAAAAAAGDKARLMTEFAPSPQNMFATAWLINNAVTVEGVSAYIYWDLTWDAPGGLVSTENPYSRSKWTTAQGYTVRDPYYAVKHFARWVDTGWTRVAATASASVIKASAFVSPDGLATTVVVLNTSAIARDIAVSTGDWAFSASNVFRTSGATGATERTSPVGPLDPGGVLTLPPLGIATVTLTQ